MLQSLTNANIDINLVYTCVIHIKCLVLWTLAEAHVLKLTHFISNVNGRVTTPTRTHASSYRIASFILDNNLQINSFHLIFLIFCLPFSKADSINFSVKSFKFCKLKYFTYTPTHTSAKNIINIRFRCMWMSFRWRSNMKFITAIEWSHHNGISIFEFV